VEELGRVELWRVEGGWRIQAIVYGKELQGDVATELQVFCLIDHSHAPAADPAEDAVMRNRLTHGLGGRGHAGIRILWA
jgi:hypothetical protein